MNWFFPISPKIVKGIPINHHPGAFGFRRRNNYHTGVDLYVPGNVNVFPCEQGTVVKIDQFTGLEDDTGKWMKTWAVMIEGESGVINYGEIEPNDKLKIVSYVNPDNRIGRVLPVIYPGYERPDIPGHSRFMLHLELHKHGTREFPHWHPIKEPSLLDPTFYLFDSLGCPQIILTWENPEGREVG